MGQNTVTTYEDLTSEGFAYDSVGRMTSFTDRNAIPIAYAYDKYGHRTQITFADSTGESLAFDEADRRTLATDARGNSVSYAFDNMNLETRKTYPDTAYETYAYDGNGNRTRRTDANGAQVYYGYDNMNRLTRITYPGGATLDYAYDGAGRLTSLVDSDSTVTYAYDAIGRVTQETQNGRNVAYAYDGYGRLTAMTDNEADTTTYEYDNLNRMTLMSSPWAETTLYDYDGAGRLTHRTNGNATTVSYAYDETGRLTSLVNRDSASQVISSNSYALDGVGNRLSNTTQRGTDNYYYDVKYQLTSATHPTLTSEAYAYDAAGNRTVGHGYTDWAYNVNNQLTGYNGVTYGYDANGNMTSATDAGGTTSYSYDYENRLVQVNFPGSGYAAYKYDGQGRRIEKSVNGVITRYLYNGSDPIAEYDGAGVLQAKYLHGRGWGEPLAMLRGETVYWYHGEGLGSVTEVTDAVEDVVEQYVYDSFGNLHVYDGTGNPLSQTAIGNCFTYIGREYDNESDLYYLRARYYSPEKGRFLSRDPIPRGNLDLSLPLNLYPYANNNPSTLKDPTGLASSSECDVNLFSGHRIMIRYIGGKAGSGYYDSPPKRWVEMSISANCRNTPAGQARVSKCKFIQQMMGHIIMNGAFYTDTYWGRSASNANWSHYVVDSHQPTPYYPTKYRIDPTTSNLELYMEDTPGYDQTPATYPLIDYKVDFLAGIYTDYSGTSKVHSIAGDGSLVGPPAVVTPVSWRCHFESNMYGVITRYTP